VFIYPASAAKHNKGMYVTFIYLHLQGNHRSSGVQCEVAYWLVLAVDSAAQLVAAH